MKLFYFIIIGLLKKLILQNFFLLRYIPETLFEENNTFFCVTLDAEEVRRIIFKLNGDITSGPDGMSGRFYHTCWSIVGNDVLKLVKSFLVDNIPLSPLLMLI